jgi:hypothetical protein
MITKEMKFFIQFNDRSYPISKTLANSLEKSNENFQLKTQDGNVVFLSPNFDFSFFQMASTTSRTHFYVSFSGKNYRVSREFFTILSATHKKLSKGALEKHRNINLDKFSPKTRGYLCSVNGALYEQRIHSLLTNCYLNGKKFNTQLQGELGGSTASNDLKCNNLVEKDIGVEVKKSNSPD